MIFIKKLCILFSLIFCISLTGCYSQNPIPEDPDQNNNYISSDVDENGNLISRPVLEIPSESEEIQSEEISDGEMTVYFIDVGNADCSLIEFSDGTTMLIDAGNVADGEDICSYLDYLGVDEINYLIATHPHEDHIGGMVDVINTIPVDNMYMPQIPDAYVPTTKIYSNLLESIDSHNLTVTAPSAGEVIKQDDDTTVKFLNSPDKINSSNMNEYSLVVKITYKNTSFIFTGDAEKEEEEMMLQNFSKKDLDCDVLKVAHHGSTTSNTAEWLEALTPEYAYIPCGTGNQYGHPHDEIIEELTNMGIEYYRADYDGTVKITSDGNNITVKTKLTGDVPLGSDSWTIDMAV